LKLHRSSTTASLSAVKIKSSRISCKFNEYPLFVGGDPYDYHITEFSPCRDSGTNDTGTYPYLPTDDIDCEPRTYETDYDIGVDEWMVCIKDGDINNDWVLTAEDAQIAFQIALGLITPVSEEWCSTDCDGNGQITAGDAQLIFLSVLGMDSCVQNIPTPMQTPTVGARS